MIRQEERIKKMESILDDHQEVLDSLSQVLSRFEQNQENFQALKDYYASQDCFQDIADAGAGKISSDLKCGVLSQDAVFNLIGQDFDLTVRMLEVATESIKNH